MFQPNGVASRGDTISHVYTNSNHSDPLQRIVPAKPTAEPTTSRTILRGTNTNMYAESRHDKREM
jgi:hypothetical protein